jgi:hypothetical protein
MCDAGSDPTTAGAVRETSPETVSFLVFGQLHCCSPHGDGQSLDANVAG